MTRKVVDPSANPPAPHTAAASHAKPASHPKPPPAPQPPPPPHKAPHPHKAPGPISLRLFATMERAALDQKLGGIHLNLASGAVVSVLSQDWTALDAIVLPLARIARALLPQGVLDPSQMGVLVRQQMPSLQTFTSNVANSLRVLGQHGIPFEVQPDHVLDLMKKRGHFAGFKLLGQQMTNAGMDQRQVSGAFLVFLVDRVVGALDRRFNDPKLPQAIKDKMLENYGPALLNLDEVLRNPVVRKQDLAARRGTLEQQMQDAQAEAQLAEMSLRLRQNLVLPREGLFAAARRHQQKQEQLLQQGPGLLADLPVVTPGPAAGPNAPRRIIT